jgi:hypothetical protein
MRFALLVPLILLLAAPARSHADDTTPAPPPASAPNVVTAPDVFHYTAPAGWKIVLIRDGQFPAAMEKKGDDITGLITVNMDTAPGELGDWCKNSIAKNEKFFADYNPTFGPIEVFNTPAGNAGYTCVITLTANGRLLHTVYYFFAGRNDAKFAVTCTCPQDNAAHDDPLFQQAAKTFVSP